MVDEDGKFTELAGPELQNLSVMSEGTDKGATKICENKKQKHLEVFVCNFCFFSYLFVFVESPC